MKRGTLLTAVFSSEFGKPRPALVVQADPFGELGTVVLCPLTSDLTGGGPLRVQIEPDEMNGLRQPSLVMIDKVAALSIGKTREIIGQITDDQLSLVGSRLALLLALAD